MQILEKLIAKILPQQAFWANCPWLQLRFNYPYWKWRGLYSFCINRFSDLWYLFVRIVATPLEAQNPRRFVRSRRTEAITVYLWPAIL